MKKFLSLVLALVMAMSLVTVSAGAKDFNDSDKISDVAYEEAVNVMSEMGIIDGYGDGNFQPQGTLTRGAAAKIIACMMLGKTTAEALGTQAAPFKDVPVGSTFAGYIAYCSESGIIDGYSDGTFRPGNTLTGFAFLKMLLTALGYDSEIEGYANNANWTVNVAGRAKQIGLLDGNDNFVGTRAATREEACLYALNALQATLVEYNDKGGSISVGDITINTGASNATYVTSNVYDAATSIDDTWDNTTHDYTVEFAEKYQPDLRLDRDVDAFGRPSHTWTWKRVEIGSYIDQDKLVTEYTTKVTGRDLYDLLGSYVVDNDTFVVTIDGVDDVRVNNAVFGANNIIKSNTKAVGATGNGVLTQVFRDSADGITYIAIINTYLAEATDDFDEDDDILDVDVYGYSEARRVKDTSIDANDDCIISGMEADNENVPVADYEDGDIMMVRIADGEILEVMDPEVLADSTVTAFSLTKDTVTTGGTTYDKADTRLYDLGVLDDIDDYTGTPTLKGLTYNILLDPYGYVIGIERNEDPDQYVFITGYEEYSKNLSTAVAEAGAIFVDGTMKRIEVDVDDALTDNDNIDYNWDADGVAVLNRWYTYTVDKDGVYSLKNIYVADNSNPFGDTGDIETLPAGDISDVSDDVAQFAWSYTDKSKDIDKSHISLPAWAAAHGDTQGLVDPDTDAGETTGVGRVVYGNADSVYLTVGTKVISNATQIDDARIINKVKSVTTGVKNANITVDAYDFDTALVNGDPANRGNASAGVYTLYNDKGYIVASVVVGDDAAASTNYVFVTSANASLEEDLGEDADSRWTREVLVNGELKDLVYVGDEIDYIDKNSMDQGLIYKVSYDADGYVIDSEQVTVYDAVYGPSIYARFDNSGDQVINNISAVEGNDDAVLLIVDLSVGNNELNTDKWTLYTTQDQTRGISLADDAKAVLIENVDGTMFDEVTIFDNKSENVKAAIKALYADEFEDHNAPFNGAVYAILEDGMATSVIIVDNNDRPDDFDGGTIIPGDNVITNGDATLVVTNTTSAAIFDAENVRISNSGVISYEFNVGAANVGKEITFNINVTVDDVRVERQVAVTDTVAADGSVSGSVDIGGNYDKGSDVVLGITVTDLETPVVADPEMTYQVEYALESGVVISNEAAVTVKKSAVGDSFTVTGTAPAGYVFVGSDERTVTFQAGANVTVTFVVEKEAVEETATVIKVVADGATVSIGGVVKGNGGVYDNNYAKGDVIEFTVANDGVVDPAAAVVTFNGEPVTLKSNKASVTLVEGENVLNVSISPKQYTVAFDWDTSNGGNWNAVESVTGVKNEVVEITLTRKAPMAFDWSQYKVTANGSALTAVDGTAVNGVAAVADSYADASVSDADDFATAKAEHGKLFVEESGKYYEVANYIGSNTYFYFVEGDDGTVPSITVEYKITGTATVTLKVSK